MKKQIADLENDGDETDKGNSKLDNRVVNPLIGV